MNLQMKRAARMAPEAARGTAVGETKYSVELASAQHGPFADVTPAALMLAAEVCRRFFPGRPLPAPLQQQIGAAWARSVPQ